MPEHAAERLTILDALATAVERRNEVLTVLDDATSDDQAVKALAALLSTSEAAATAVLDLQLRRFMPAHLDRIDAERRLLRGGE